MYIMMSIMVIALGVILYYLSTLIQNIKGELEYWKDFIAHTNSEVIELGKKFHFGPVPPEKELFKFKIEELTNNVHAHGLEIKEMKNCLMTLSKLVLKENPKSIPKKDKPKKKSTQKVKAIKFKKGEAVAYTEPAIEEN